MIELNIPYTNKKIAQQLFKIKASTFNNKKSRYLEYLKQFYDYEIINKKIVLRKELKPFKTMMQTRESRKNDQAEVYRDLTHKIINYKPLNSGSNIARQIVQSPLRPFDHTQGTAENYVRPVLKSEFEVIDKRWCGTDYETNEYIPLSTQELNYLMELFQSKDLSKNILDITADYKCGNIDKKEFEEKVSSVAQSKYDLVMNDFKKKFGFRPQKVSNWREKKPILNFKEKVG